MALLIEQKKPNLNGTRLYFSLDEKQEIQIEVFENEAI